MKRRRTPEDRAEKTNSSDNRQPTESFVLVSLLSIGDTIEPREYIQSSIGSARSGTLAKRTLVTRDRVILF